MISFWYTGGNYICSDQFFEQGLVILPNRLVLEVKEWFSSIKKPRYFREAATVPPGQTISSAAKQLTASIAIKARPLVFGEPELLQPGDPIIYASGTLDSHVEAEAIIIGGHYPGVPIKITKVIFSPPSNPKLIQIGDIKIIFPEVLFRPQ